MERPSNQYHRENKYLRNGHGKQSMIAFYFAIVFVLLTIYQCKYMQGEKKLESTYYIHFDFDKSQDGTTALDTVSIMNRLLACFAEGRPNDVFLTESDLKEKLKLTDEECNRDPDYNTRFYAIDLGLAGAIFLTISPHETYSDSIIIETRETFYHDRGSTKISSSALNSYDLKNLEVEYKNSLPLFFGTARSMPFVGIVESFEDSLLIFKFNKNLKAQNQQCEGEKLLPDDFLLFRRIYTGESGYLQLLRDIQRKIDYLKDEGENSFTLQNAMDNYNHIKNELKSKLTKGDSHREYIDIKGKVIQMSDSTGRATWSPTEIYPFEKPQKGDEIIILVSSFEEWDLR